MGPGRNTKGSLFPVKGKKPMTGGYCILIISVWYQLLPATSVFGFNEAQDLCSGH